MDVSGKLEVRSKTSDEDLANRLQFCLSVILGGLKATHVAEELGVSVSAVTKWLRSGRVSREHLVNFALVYEVSIEWLLTGMGSVRRSSESSAPKDEAVPVYPLSALIFTAGQALVASASDTEPVGRFFVGAKADVCFAAETSAPEVSARLAPRQHYLFSSEYEALRAGDLVVVARKSGKSTELHLRIYAETLHGPKFVAESNLVPDFSEDDVEIAGLCTAIQIPSPRLL